MNNVRRRARRRDRAWSLVREIGLTLLTAGAVVLLFVAYELVGTNFTEEHSQARLATQFNRAVSALTTTTTSPTTTLLTRGSPTSTAVAKPATTTTPSTAPAARTTTTLVPLPVAPPGGALDHLVVPAIGVNRYVVEGVTETDLQMGPGHYPGTPLPGQSGNVAIAGHRTTFGAPFFQLNELVRGDLIYLTDTTGTTWVYAVQRQWVVAPTDVGVLNPLKGAELTMTTCNPRFEATSRLVVRASLYKRMSRGATLAGPLPVTVAVTHAAKGAVHRALPTVSTLPSPAPTTTTAASSGPVPPGGPSGGTSPSSGDNPTVGASPGAQPETVLGSGGAGAWGGALAWGALALGAWVVTRVAGGRRPGAAKVLVLAGGALVCLVPLWFAFENVVNLLPANI